MITLTNSKQPTKAILIGETEGDVKTLRFLMDTHIVWGFYKLLVVDENNKDYPEVVLFQKNIPTVKAIGWLNSPEGFVPRGA